MKKNVAGQFIGTQVISASDGSEFTGAVTVYITKDDGSQTIGSVASGVCTHKGKGYHQYAPSQAETNADHVSFTFEGTGAITTTVQVDTEDPLFFSVIAFGTGVTESLDTVTIASPSSPAGIYADWTGMLLVVEDTDDTKSICVRQILLQGGDELHLNGVIPFYANSNSRYWILPGSGLEVKFNNRLPLKDYLTGTNDPYGDPDGWAGEASVSESLEFGSVDRIKLDAIYNKLPSKSHLTGSNNTDGDVQLNEATGAFSTGAFSLDIGKILNPRILTNGTIMDVASTAGLTEIRVASPDSWFDTSGIKGCTFLSTDGNSWKSGTITSANWEDDILYIYTNSQSGIFSIDESYVIFAPESLGPSGIKRVWEGDPDTALVGYLVAGTAGSTTISILATGGSWGTVKPGDIVKLWDQSTGITHFHRVNYTSYPNIVVESPIVFSISAHNDTFVVAKDSLAIGSPSPKLILDTLYDKLPSSNYLAGSAYSDGTIDTGDIGNLEATIVAGVQAALDGSDITFSVEALNTMRDHFYGGKLFIESAVDDSTVTPTTTSFAGGNSLSSANDFYSKTNSVVAFTTGNLQGLCGLVVDYDGATRRFYFDGVWPEAPAAGDQFVLLGKITTQA